VEILGGEVGPISVNHTVLILSYHFRTDLSFGIFPGPTTNFSVRIKTNFVISPKLIEVRNSCMGAAGGI
jgi:hypothetical protein